MADKNEYIDLRKLSREALLQVRRQVVRLKKKGYSGREIEEIVGIRQNRISEIWSAYLREGEAFLEPKKSKRPGKPTLLTPEEQTAIQNAFASKTPQKLGLRGNVWTQSQAAEFIRQTYNKNLAQRTVSSYLERWGFRAKKRGL